jgi:amino acid adenylation domain-containing protein
MTSTEATSSTPGAAHPRGLVQSVLDQARRTPAAAAVVDGDRTLDYAQLDRHSAAVARALRARGIRSGQAVAVCLPRSWQLVCVMLGVLRAGATVVPLDAHSPLERQRHILTDSAATLLVHADARDRHKAAHLAAVASVPADSLVPEAADEDLDNEATPDSPAIAFLFYTSGTTGTPKGVEVREAGVMRLAQPGYIRLAEGARYACLSNPAFDALSFEVWAPLLTGGCCVILGPEEAQTPHLLAQALIRERIDTMFVTTALFNAVVDKAPECFATVGQVLIGGEALNAPLIGRWYRHNTDSATRLFNAYGPTESTTFALCHPIPCDFDADAVPLGKPLPGTGALLVAGGTRQAEAEEVAELHLSGVGLAAGYRNLPEETDRRFVRLPWYDGGQELWYRTGDLVRQDAEGGLAYVGRDDRQVKVRGFRIEPGEVEKGLLSHPAVRHAHVGSRRDAAGNNELLAYLVLREDVSYEEFDRHLTASLPTYMRPHRLFRLDKLPLTANGKVDSAALLRHATKAWRPRGDAQQQVTPWQREVLNLAGGILGAPDLGPRDRWVPQGGDSLKVLRFRFEVRRRWGCELPQSLVMGSDLGAVAAAIEEGRSATEQTYPAVSAPQRERRSAPATSEQQRLWLMQQRDPQSRAYHVPLAFRITGEPDMDALREALRRLVARHPALRTSFHAAAEGLVQRVGDPYDPWCSIAVEDGDSWEDAARSLFSEPFDLARPRMMSAGWVPQGRDGATGDQARGGVLVLHLHHIAVDGWSLSVLFRELSDDYAALTSGEHEGDPTPEPPAQTASRVTLLDVAFWQEQWFATAAYAGQRDALRAHYATAENVSPSPAPIRSTMTRPQGRLMCTSLDLVRRTALDRLGAELGLTRFQLLLSVFSWSLYGVTGLSRPLIGSPVAGRPVPDFDNSVGMFANTMLLPLVVEPREDLRAQLLTQATTAAEILERQDVAFADAVDGLSLRADGPPFDFLFVLENTEFAALTLPGCEVGALWPQPLEAKCPLTLSVVEHEAGFHLLWEYSEEHFDAALVDAMARLFAQGLDRLAQDHPGTLADLVLPYRRSLPELGRGREAPAAYETVAEGFASQAGRTPDAPAVTGHGRTLSYSELDAQAAALAAELSARYPLPVDPEHPCHIALYLPPSIEHVVALLALARLNVTAVPLDPDYPPALLRSVLEQVEPLCVLMLPGDPGAADGIVPQGMSRHPIALPSAPPPARHGTPYEPRRPLYTLFTSGSTGTPKGVQVPDSTLSNLLGWQSTAGLDTPAVTQQFSMLSFDVSFQEIFTTLCGGGHLHLIRPEWRRNIPTLLEQLESTGTERLFMPYVALQLLAEHGVRAGRYPSRLREVITAGEQLVCTDAIRRWFARLPGARLFNHYGPTETHVVSSLCLDGDPALWPTRPAIGRPVAGAHLRVVDDEGEPVPAGATGELLIGGLMATPCYLGQPELNRTRFTELPGLGTFYRSGDLARFDGEGLLHHVGRADEQIKLSGHRLELGEVEAALLQYPGIGSAVVVGDGGQLKAYLETHGEPPSVRELNDHLAGLLPPHVRINRFRRVAALPRTPSGKLDRRAALSVMGEDLAMGPAEGLQSALSPLEARLTALFVETTGKPVAPDQRFFDAGATSLDLMRFHLRCTAEPDLVLTVADLFEQVTIRRLARLLNDAGGSPKARPNERTEAAPGRVPGQDEPIAVVGMAVRLPGASDLGGFWDLVRSARRGMEHFPAAEGRVGARSQMAGLLSFDPGHFGMSPQEARLMDPQQRHLLMNCVEALAHAGIADPAAQRVGLVASCGENTYFQAMLREADPADLPDEFQLALHHDTGSKRSRIVRWPGDTGAGRR